MSGSKHPPSGREPEDVRLPADDLERDPGIGQSKGLTTAGERDNALIEGEHTVEGDRENDTTPQGGLSPQERDTQPTTR